MQRAASGSGAQVVSLTHETWASSFI